MTRQTAITLLIVAMLALPVLARLAAGSGFPVGLAALAALVGAGAVLAWFFLAPGRGRRPPR